MAIRGHQDILAIVVNPDIPDTLVRVDSLDILAIVAFPASAATVATRVTLARRELLVTPGTVAHLASAVIQVTLDKVVILDTVV